MKYLIAAALLVFTFLAPGISQVKQVCGTIDQTEILERLKENKRALKANPQLRNGEVLFVPIQFHVVTKADGSGGIDEEKILQQLCRLNEDYDALNMHFYFKDEFNYIAYDKLYEDPGHTFSSVKMSANKVDNAINVFIVDQIGSNGSGTTLGYFQPNKDWIVAIRSKVNGSSQTVSHEIGHFFSLAHTFYGWESCPYNKPEHGSPVKFTHLPSDCGGALIELVDGSNCEDAADLLCDTSPDYNFGLTDPENNCSLDYEVLDFNSDPVDPMENNYMGYFFSCPDYLFTDSQKELMRADFQSSGRAYLRDGYIPDTTLLNGGAPNITMPAHGSTTNFYDEVLLNWDDVPGASSYLVKVTTGFFTKVETYYMVNNESKLWLYDLPPSENNVSVVIWPFNEGSTCNLQANQTHKFKTSSIPVSVKELTEVDGFKLFPVPVSINNGYFTLWSDKELKNAIIKIQNIEGKEVLSWNKNINVGENHFEIGHQYISEGIHVLLLLSGEETFTKKIMISK